MSVKKCVTLLTCLSFGLTLTLAERIGKESLRGLEGTEVVVDATLPSETVKQGLTNDWLQTYVELRLRKAGIKVLTEDERRNTPGSPFLFASVSGVQTTLGYAYYIDLSQYQKVTLSRDLGKMHKTFGSNWETAERLGVEAKEALARSLDLNLMVLLEQTMSCATWEATSTIGVTPRDSLRRTVREAVADMVDAFINDYLAVNPKQ